MSDVIAPALLDAGGLPQSMKVREALALVWAEDEVQAEAAVEALRHALWPYYYLFRIDEVRQFVLGSPCPLRDEDPPVLASMRRPRWAWVLVEPGTEIEAVASCT